MFASILQKDSPGVFFRLLRFLLLCLVSISFLLHLKYISFFSFILICPLPISPGTFRFPFSENAEPFLIWQFYLLFSKSLFEAWHIFLCQVPFQYFDWISLLPLFESLIIFHFVCKLFDVIHILGGWSFSSYFVNLQLHINFLMK